MSATVWRALLLGCFTASSSSSIHAVCPPGEQLQYSADQPATISGVFAHDHDYFIDTGTSRSRARIEGLPESSDLDALQVDTDYSVLFSLDVAAALGATTFDRADLVRKSGASFSLAFDASAAGIPASVNLDAAARRGVNLLLSFDRGFKLGSTYIRPADVVEFAGNTLVGKVLDAAALGLASSLDVDAVHAVSNGELLVSFDSGGRIGSASLVFADEDVLDLVLAGAVWTKPCAMLARSDGWAAMDLDALSATAGGDGLFKDGFE